MLLFPCRKAARQYLPFFNTILILAPSLLFPGGRGLVSVNPAFFGLFFGSIWPVFGGKAARWRAVNIFLIQPPKSA